MGFFDKIAAANIGRKTENQPCEQQATPHISEKIPEPEPKSSAECAITPPCPVGKVQATAPETPGNDRPRASQKAAAVTFIHRKVSHDSPESFKKSWPWLSENLSSLLQSGWTRRTLFQRSACRYPAGHWGVAWFDVWQKPDLSAKIAATGTIEFSFSSGSRQVRQTATRPPARMT